MDYNIEQKEKISVILPVYNGEKTLQRAIDSILNQSYKNLEVIIINNASIDKTQEIIENNKQKYKNIISIKNETNLGLQKSLNIGLNVAAGKYIARIDSDDEWVDVDKIKKQYSFFESNTECVLIGTNIISVEKDRTKKVFNPETDEKIRRKIIGRNCFAHSSVMFKKEVVKIIGGYSENDSEKHVEDYDLWLKIGSFGKMYNIQDFCVKYESGPESISNKNKNQQVKNHYLLVKKYFNIYRKNILINKFKNYLRYIYYIYIKK
ncbi:MAG TPA: glycosyltransferase [Candidatus Paceibacterota bacterium]|nr:glycosyltransferase [Candidatus Paceibacterota bacterium]HMP19091.1 glycosyltransferase [Candidatus Paceibacterota bacterium]